MGEYEGIFIGAEFGYLNLRQTHTYAGREDYVEDHEWRVTNPNVMKKIAKLKEGDPIIVEVEFNNYTVTNAWGPESGRMLKERIEKLERIVAELTAPKKLTLKELT